VIERLRAGYERQFGRSPDAQEMRGLVTAQIREEVLCREALALGLDRDDTIVRRRLAQKMEFLTNDVVRTAEATDTAVREYFNRHAARYAKPGRISFRQVYFSSAKRGGTAATAATGALAELAKGARDETLGDPFLSGYNFPAREAADIVATFGPEFAKQLAEQATGDWHGPLSSGYGLHLVRVDARQEPRAVKFDEVGDLVLRDFNEELRQTANAQIFEKLREQYDVHVDEIAVVRAGAGKMAQR